MIKWFKAIFQNPEKNFELNKSMVEHAKKAAQMHALINKLSLHMGSFASAVGEMCDDINALKDAINGFEKRVTEIEEYNAKMKNIKLIHKDDWNEN